MDAACFSCESLARRARLAMSRCKGYWLVAARCGTDYFVARGTILLNREHDMKTKQFIHLLLISCMSCFVSTACRADQSEDEAAIRKSDEAYVAAYNKQDAKALAALWSPEAVYVDPETGEQAVGREEIEKEFAETFKGSK